MKFSGYRRNDGSVGVRNHVLFLSTVVCANGIVHQIGCEFPKAICLEHDKGCIELGDDREMTRSMLIGLARNPNVGAVVFVGLGCEDTTAKYLEKELQGQKTVTQVTIQDEKGTTNSLNRCRALAKQLLEETAKATREPCEAGKLVLATKCGGTDWTSALASNPAVGIVSDRIVAAGGTSFLGETIGWYGAEKDYFRRVRNEDCKKQIIKIMQRRYEDSERRGMRVEKSNPSPGNIEGGITTLVEKALGSSRKSGESIIEGVLSVGEYPPGPGLWLMDNPGIDPGSLAGMAAAGAQIVLFTTGRGTPTGSPLCPVIKICASPNGVAALRENTDIDLTDIVMQGATLQSGADRIEDRLWEVANGKLTISEQFGHREFVMPTVDLL